MIDADEDNVKAGYKCVQDNIYVSADGEENQVAGTIVSITEYTATGDHK